VPAALVTGLVIASWQAVRATKAEVAARQGLEDARAALDFIRDDLLGQANPDRQPDPNLTVRKLLDHASTQLDQPFARPPKVEAAIRQTIGSVNLALGEYAPAFQHLQRALDLQRQHIGPANEDTLRTVHILGQAHWWNGDDIEALHLARQGLELSRRALGETNLMTLHGQIDAHETAADHPAAADAG
jgi:eukaryotic-like serine/threonine-protein kinase